VCPNSALGDPQSSFMLLSAQIRALHGQHRKIMKGVECLNVIVKFYGKDLKQICGLAHFTLFEGSKDRDESRLTRNDHYQICEQCWNNPTH
jgi:hypothetical protein